MMQYKLYGELGVADGELELERQPQFGAAGGALGGTRRAASRSKFFRRTGQEFVLLSGQTVATAYVRLPAGALVRYEATGPDTYWHPDWLGMARLYSNPSHVIVGDAAYALFGEVYNSAPINSFFTGVAQNVEANDFRNFPARDLHTTEGRWLTPDPAGLAAVDLTNPQTLNRYAYVMNNPLANVDPTGTCSPSDNPPCYSASATTAASGDPDFATSEDPYLINNWISFLLYSLERLNPGNGSGSDGVSGGTTPTAKSTPPKNLTGPIKVLDCAGYTAARSVLPQTKAQGIEFGGFIYKNNQSSSYFYSAPFSGTPGALPSFDVHRTQDTPSGFSLAGWFHSHPLVPNYPHPELFSGADVGATRRVGGPGYLLTPKGDILKLLPYPPNAPVAPTRVSSNVCQGG